MSNIVNPFAAEASVLAEIILFAAVPVPITFSMPVFVVPRF